MVIGSRQSPRPQNILHELKFHVPNRDIHVGPPQRTSHISSIDSCSCLLFSALGIPSKGVMKSEIGEKGLVEN
jgi:hypothetical protein